MTIILFLIVLVVLILVHELGHFFSAKYFGIRVDEFALGFPPRLFSFKKGETEYSLNAIPAGGYVKIFGENPDDESLNGPDKKRSLVYASWRKQIIILLSGIFMNLIFAWILISAAFNIGIYIPLGDIYKEKAKDVSAGVLLVVKDSPADKAGLREGDRIVGIKSGEISQSMPSLDDLDRIISESSKSVTIEYKRDNLTNSVDIFPQTGIFNDKKAIGIAMDLFGTVRFGFFQSIYEGLKLTIIETKEITFGIIGFVYNLLKGHGSALSEISGPVGIASLVGQASGKGLTYLLSFVAMISINLAVLNSVPFPAFDGGRVLFVLVETVIRRKIKPAILNWANLVGFGLIIILLICVTYKDILSLIR